MNGRLIDLRNENKIQTQTSNNWVPAGKTNILFDIVANGEKVGDLELGDDGFLQINIFSNKGFIKINTHVDVKSYGADKGIKSFADGERI